MVPKLIGLLAMLGGVGFGAYKMLEEHINSGNFSNVEQGKWFAVGAMALGVGFATWGMFAGGRKDKKK